MEDCKHKNTLDPYPYVPMDQRVIWCSDCGALILPNGTVRVPKRVLQQKRKANGKA